MQLIRKIFFYFTIFISCLVILTSLLSLVHDFSLWYSKVLDFPRMQYLVIAVLFLLAFIILNRKWRFPAVFLTLGLLGSIIIQSGFILPYYLGEKKVPETDEATVKQENIISIMIANVLIDNRNADVFLTMVNRQDPHLLLVMEVDHWWINQLMPLEQEYEQVVKYPLENAYGIALYSKLPLLKSEIEFLKHLDVPSIHTKVILPSGRKIRFHGMHPVAPVPSQKYPDNEGEEEVALIKVGAMVENDSLPSIVAGDFNDVSWSNTSRLFERETKLNNVRIGRGMYNSFNAQSSIFRWPLDHYFVSQEFALIDLVKLPEFGSDHFPMLATFALSPSTSEN